MGGRGANLGRGELKPEIRLKIYNEAIQHYERAKTYEAAGESEKALQEVRKAVGTVKAFPEAYQLAQTIYLKLGKAREAQEQENLFRQHGGDRGASLYRLRDRIAQEIAVIKRNAPPPDFKPLSVYLASVVSTGVLLFGIFFEYRRFSRQTDREQLSTSALMVERFPGDEPFELSPSWLFKLLSLLLPLPLIFSILVYFGARYYSEAIGPFVFCWVIVDIAIYLIFFADFSDFGGFRRPGGSI